MKREACRI